MSELETGVSQLTPEEQTEFESLLSKIISMVSKLFDKGREDGLKPCPKEARVGK